MFARRSATGRRPVAEGCRDDLVARRFRLLQVKPLCDQIDCRKVFGGRRQVADRSPTGWRLIVADNPDTVFNRRLIADQPPIGCRPISKKLQTFCNQKRTLKIQSPIQIQSPTNRQWADDRSPTDRRLIADGSATTVRLHDSRVRSLSATEPMLDLFLVSSSDINLKAISWRQFYKRYFNHRSLKF